MNRNAFGMQKMAEQESMLGKVKDTLTSPDTWKNVGIGAGTGAATYLGTGLVPGLKEQRALRLLLGLMTGGTAGYFGSDIRDASQKAWNWSKAKTNRLLHPKSKEEKAELAARQSQMNSSMRSGGMH